MTFTPTSRACGGDMPTDPFSFLRVSRHSRGATTGHEFASVFVPGGDTRTKRRF
jgi:hypothetical protein